MATAAGPEPAAREVGPPPAVVQAAGRWRSDVRFALARGSAFKGAACPARGSSAIFVTLGGDYTRGKAARGELQR